MAKSKTRTYFHCQSCGANYTKWQGQCHQCNEWNTIVEEVQTKDVGSRGWKTQDAGAVVNINDVVDKPESTARFSTQMSELDRVLGGGVVEGSFLLLGGSPGIGKSTIALQIAGSYAEASSVLYISAEESVNQTAMRARRLSIQSEHLNLASESELGSILSLADKTEPKLIVIDSIQTIYLQELTSAPGTVSQVRECAARLLQYCKLKNVTVVLIGHVTKDGQLAGPRVLEHMVDTVLSFEGDSQQFRLLRTIKNRFGPANELAVFEMRGDGLKQVDNPSEFFLEQRGESAIGSAVFASIEGTRPILCEVQALTNFSTTSFPRRTSVGFDMNRLHLLLAVLDRFAKEDFSQTDVFISVAGGLKITEPAIDLAVAAAILSSKGNKELPANVVFAGEVGLTGEIRSVPFVETRYAEALKLGFSKIVLPHKAKKQIEVDTGLKPFFIHNIEKLGSFF